MIGRLRFRLSKHFGAKNVLDDFALEVRGGEFVTFLGPSGCGKSTALNLLAGLLAPSAGEIWLDDERLDPLPPERRGFGMVFQSYALFPHLSVFDNVAFGLDVRRVASACAACWRSSGSRASRRGIPRSCPAASSSAWPSPARW